MLKEKIRKIIQAELLALKKSGFLVIPNVLFELERPAEETYGDYSVNVAMKLAKVLKKSPLEVAQLLTSRLLKSKEARKLFSKIEAKEPGFINFYLSADYFADALKEILKQQEKFGNLNIGKKEKMQVEFISANPTGPLTLGNGRGAFLGDVLVNVLKKAGYRVEREYYINDVGEQILKLGHSVLGDSEAVYRGEYIDQLKKDIKGSSAREVGDRAAKVILEEMIKPLVEKKLKIKFDQWFLESKLYQSGEVDQVITELKKKDLLYEQDGALWFKSTNYGDDKDRVLIKAPAEEKELGEKTYFASDIAYIKNKLQRGFKKLIYIWGADHFGYINRMKAATQALGHTAEDMQIIIMQLVRLVENGQEVRMSKRTGVYVLLEELVDEVGLDAARFFFLMRSADSHLNFDLGLAKEQSQKNPVYYVQYAFARMHGIVTKLKTKNEKLKVTSETIKLLNHSSELSLMRELSKFAEVVESVAQDYQVQRLPQYALDLVMAFHKFYEDCRVITEDKKLTQSRLALVRAAKIVLKNVLDLMGINAPEKM